MVRHNIKGVYTDHENNRFQWFPSDLEENVFFLLGSLAKAFDVKLEGNVYELGDGEYAINFVRRSRGKANE